MEYNEPLIIQKSPDWRESRSLRTFKKYSPTIRANMEDNFPLVLVTPKLTSTQLKSTKGTSMDTQTTETPQQSMLSNSQTSTYLSEDSLARLSVLLESELDLTTPEGRSFLTSQGFLKKNNHNIWYSKMSKVYLVTTAAGLSRQSLGFSPTWGILWNGRYLTAKTSEFPKTESVSTLSDILETNVDEKYFLSQEQTKKILASSGKMLRTPLTQTITKEQTPSKKVDVRSYEQTSRVYQRGGAESDSANRIRRASYTDGARIRRLTPLECERLQGFPDNWTAGESDTQRYKMCGNAVTVNTVEAVMKSLLNHSAPIVKEGEK